LASADLPTIRKKGACSKRALIERPRCVSMLYEALMGEGR
jgi:hypothetical protein